MKRLTLYVATMVIFSGGTSFAAEQTWTGRISTGMCTAAMKRDCILNCVKAGEKYVLVSQGKVHKIQNQDFGDLPTHAGDTVTLTGELGSDGAITVTKVAMPAKGKK